jgi:hypothetical protein
MHVLFENWLTIKTEIFLRKLAMIKFINQKNVSWQINSFQYDWGWEYSSMTDYVLTGFNPQYA